MKGLDNQEMSYQDNQGLGFRNIKNRVALLKGSIQLKLSQAGTTVIIEILSTTLTL